MHSGLVMAIAAATFTATLGGGAAALRLRDRLHLILGFSAGAVIAVSFFDLLPESLKLAGLAPENLVTLMALGFFAYLVLDRLILFHTHLDAHSPAVSVERGWMAATSLSAHSFMDGFAIGIGFQASLAVGAVVAVAVLAHDFSDGLNTVNLILKNGGTRRQAFGWLTIDALTPVAGAAVSLFVRLSAESLSIVLALFAGFFFYIGASDLLPDSYHAHPKFLTTVMTLAGAGLLYAVIRMSG
jgi:ZIP family zinc transporter